MNFASQLFRRHQRKNQFRFFISNDKPLQKPTVDTNTKGVGLNNIQQRLLLLYGDDAQFSYIDLDETFNVTMMIPKEK